VEMYSRFRILSSLYTPDLPSFPSHAMVESTAMK